VIERHEEIDSTQRRALELAAAGAADGTVVVARRQTAGTGRYGHRWASPEGGLWLSIVLEGGPSELPVSLVGALAARAALARAAGLDARLKWPNDLFVGRRKIGGAIATERAGRFVLGLGIDVNVRRADLPADVAAIATSTLEETGREVPLEAVLDAFLAELGPRRRRAAARDPGLRDEVWSCLIREHAVRWMPPGGGAPVTGAVAGLEANGGLAIDADGRRIVVTTGDLEILWPKNG
jgi:BirA family biotin operon repressor/biotin-[acetyl-CoA-carboxylase] ligase